MPIQSEIVNMLSKRAHIQLPVSERTNIDFVRFMEDIGDLFDSGLSLQAVKLALKYAGRDLNQDKNDLMEKEIESSYVLGKARALSEQIFRTVLAIQTGMFAEQFPLLLDDLVASGISPETLRTIYKNSAFGEKKMPIFDMWYEERTIGSRRLEE